MVEYSRAEPARQAHVMTFTSGKGGVGKTCLTANIAAAMALRGAKVCIFDADTGLANINILLGLRPEFTLEHVLRGEKTINEVVVTTAGGVAVVPGASGIAACANLGPGEARRLVDALAALEGQYDYILIDSAAGVADHVLQFVEAAPTAFLVITAEPTSLTDAFSLLKLLNARHYPGQLKVIVNQAADYAAAMETYRRFAAVVEKYLSLRADYGGYVARDENLPRSVTLQSPIVELMSHSPASRCLTALADNIVKYIGSEAPQSGLSEYWRGALAESQTVVDAIGFTGTGAESAKLKADQRDQAEAALLRGIAEFVERHGEFPRAFKQLFFRWLETENHAAPRLIELVTTLEALYTARYREPMFSLESNAARLVAQTGGAEDQLRGLIRQLRDAYRQAHASDVFDLEQELSGTISRDDFTEERFEALAMRMRAAFQARFNKPYQSQSELLLESTAEALAAMAGQEQALQNEFASLTQQMRQLTSRREALLTAIEHAQQQQLTVAGQTSIDG